MPLESSVSFAFWITINLSLPAELEYEVELIKLYKQSSLDFTGPFNEVCVQSLSHAEGDKKTTFGSS